MSLENRDAKSAPQKQVTFDLKVNVVSLLNLFALVGLLFTAMGSWYGMVEKVGTTNMRIDNVTTELARIRSDVKNTLDQRDSDVRSLRDKVDIISTKTVVIDTQLTSVVETLKRVEATLEKNQVKR